MTREARVAKNHTLFREVNERIYSLAEEFGAHPWDDDLRLALVCECGNADCAAEVLIDTDAYARVRETSSRFIVLAGHELSEPVVESADGYVVVDDARSARVVA